MTAAHFIYIPSILFIGIIIGWVLGSRAAKDAYATELRRNDERSRKKEERRTEPTGTKNE